MWTWAPRDFIQPADLAVRYPLARHLLQQVFAVGFGAGCLQQRDEARPGCARGRRSSRSAPLPGPGSPRGRAGATSDPLLQRSGPRHRDTGTSPTRRSTGGGCRRREGPPPRHLRRTPPAGNAANGPWLIGTVRAQEGERSQGIAKVEIPDLTHLKGAHLLHRLRHLSRGLGLLALPGISLRREVDRHDVLTVLVGQHEGSRGCRDAPGPRLRIAARELACTRGVTDPTLHHLDEPRRVRVADEVLVDLTTLEERCLPVDVRCERLPPSALFGPLAVTRRRPPSTRTGPGRRADPRR